MEKELIILDELTADIVMNFDLVPPTKKVLSKIAYIADNISSYIITHEKNRINCKTKNNKIAHVIEVDKQNKRISIEETGIFYEKTTSNDDSNNKEQKEKVPKHFFTKKVYSEFNNKSTSYTYNREYKIKQTESNTKIDALISKNYTFYEEKKFLGSSYEEEKRVVVKDNNNNTIEEENNILKNNLYTLATGDKLKRTENNGNVSYHLLSYNKYGDNSFAKELTEQQFDELISLEQDPYIVANNDIIYEIRGTNYSL